MKIILQSEAGECGLACLGMISSHFGHDFEMAELRKRFPVSMKGMALAQVMRCAAKINLAARPLRIELESLKDLKLPAILHWEFNHFVVLKSVSEKIGGQTKMKILDPAIGERLINIAEANSSFTGIAIEFNPTVDFQEKPPAPRVKISQLIGQVRGVRRSVIQIFSLALMLEVLGLIAPMFSQFALDDVVVTGDTDLLKIMALGFGFLLVLQAGISFLRSWLIMMWSNEINVQWAGRTFSHLLKLPISYFEKRHLGDIVSRFSSLNTIQSTISGVLMESAIDGLMAALSLILMFIYSPQLTFIAVGISLVYIIQRTLFYLPLREAVQKSVILAAKENTFFLESMRAIQPLKLFGRGADRASQWLNLKQNTINQNIRNEKLQIIFRTSTMLTSAGQALALTYFGITLVVVGELTIGMMMAFASYAAVFSRRMFSLVDVFVSLKMISIHGERLADIVLEPVENDESSMIDRSTEISTSIVLNNVSFRYSEGEPWILRNVNFKIDAGDHVAIVGASGGGKTTLCKILLGLLPPTEGEIYLGDESINDFGIANYREMVGTVMQDDLLLSGSLYDNISFFDPETDSGRVEQAARLSSIYEEIMEMPMGLRTMVGDMGASLSGGQRQRILLARALYRKPKILVLDEATSHLDVMREQQVNRALTEMQLTRVVIAHRPETISTARRVVELKAGKLTDIDYERNERSVETVHS